MELSVTKGHTAPEASPLRAPELRRSELERMTEQLRKEIRIIDVEQRRLEEWLEQTRNIITEVQARSEWLSKNGDFLRKTSAELTRYSKQLIERSKRAALHRDNAWQVMMEGASQAEAARLTAQAQARDGAAETEPAQFNDTLRRMQAGRSRSSLASSS